MSTSTQIRCFLIFDTDVTITSCRATVTRISDPAIPPVPGGIYKPDNNNSFPVDVSGQEGDFFYIVVEVLEYTKGGITYNIDPATSVQGHMTRLIQYFTVFTWKDNTVYVNPMSTVASTFAFAQRIRTVPGSLIEIGASEDFCKVAYGMKNNLYDTDGHISEVIAYSPNGLETNSYPAFNFLSNMLYYCMTDASVNERFLAAVLNPPASSLDAILSVAKNPFWNVRGIYDIIADMEQVYMPSLPGLSLPAGVSPVPNQWTLAVKVHKSGAENFPISGTAYIVFDNDNRAWISNNFRQGSDRSGTHSLVLDSTGRPAPMSPIMGGGILGPGFGIAINKEGTRIAIGNYGWGPREFNPSPGSISVFEPSGRVVSPPNGFTASLTRVQGMCYDTDGNLWMASWGTQNPMATPNLPGIYDIPDEPSAIVVYVGGDPRQAVAFNNFGTGPSPFHGTFGVVIDDDGCAIVSNAGTSKVMPSSVYKVRLSANKKRLHVVAFWESNFPAKSTDQIANFEEFRQPQIDADGNVYVGGITSKRVVKLSKDLEYITAFTHNIYGPWGITFDKKGKKFITGFGEETTVDPNNNTLDMRGPFAITVIESNDEGWTGAQLMTLPTGGSEVLLANKQPLYGTQPGPNGKDLAPSYQPLMRVTSTAIDRAGNLWAANNWKPSLYDDIKSNPGGDGVVIFLGVAEPLV